MEGSSEETTGPATADADATSTPDVSVQGVLQVGGELRALVQTPWVLARCVSDRGAVAQGMQQRCCLWVGAFKPLIYAEDVSTC